MKHSVFSYMLYCSTGPNKLLLSFCKDNRMNTELVIAYYTILPKKQLVIFLIKSVFCEHAKKKKKCNGYVL